MKRLHNPEVAEACRRYRDERTFRFGAQQATAMARMSAKPRIARPFLNLRGAVAAASERPER